MNKIIQNLDLRQSQQLVMTPQLQQAIKLLQLNNVELSEFLEEELIQNPFLEKDERTGKESIESEIEDNNNAEPKDEVQAEFDEAWTGNEAKQTTTQTDFDPGSANASIGSGGNVKFEDIENSFENTMSKETTLREHLVEQLHTATKMPQELIIGELLIDQLSEAGYLRKSPEELAKQWGSDLNELERILKIMRGFEPTGIFALNLMDCLRLQLAEKDTLNEPMHKLIEHLDLIANQEHQKLAKICDVNETYLKEMIEEIKELNPKPAAQFDHLVVQTAIPDVLMKRLPKNLGGGWRVELNNDTLPKVLINESYFTEVSDRTKNKQDKEYLNTQINSANWLVRAMDQRAQTILKVAAELIEQQDAFFNYGIEFLKPMTLKDIATEIEMHESTVSRVTTNKYIGTPRGIFELKFFFTTALISKDGISHSAEAVKARIKSLIDAEKPAKILSDDKIVTLLKEEGIDLARRTVAKYREAMRIGSSVQRRKQKKKG